ncbi:hypothetical protein [Algiphilus sp.]|uniref:hypothetical protein n=1 Tax=Algiphilus sp. TaxID=1872431 RepID=UPI0025BC6B20|nr:hypothetical protein [Algiphilus sp.]MCK5770831.1 hypothetical protein [Algiphilus sp.]
MNPTQAEIVRELIRAEAEAAEFWLEEAHNGAPGRCSQIEWERHCRAVAADHAETAQAYAQMLPERQA